VFVSPQLLTRVLAGGLTQSPRLKIGVPRVPSASGWTVDDSGLRIEGPDVASVAVLATEPYGS
jgi:hypothetical protein